MNGLAAVVASPENPRCVIYEPRGDASVVYVAFRGTLTRDDIRVILAHALAPFDVKGYACALHATLRRQTAATTFMPRPRRAALLVHEGMGYILNSIWSELDKALAKYPGRRIVFTGHSLGGALAIVCVQDGVCAECGACGNCPQPACTRSILSRKPGRDRARFSAVTFGAPLVIAHTETEQRLDAGLFESVKPHIANYIYACDIVPRLLGKGLSRNGAPTWPLVPPPRVCARAH